MIFRKSAPSEDNIIDNRDSYESLLSMSSMIISTCIFCQLAARRVFAPSTRDFQRCVPRISNFLMEFVISEHTVCFLYYVSAKSMPFPIESCTFTPQNGRKSRRTDKMGVSSPIAIVARASQRKSEEREIG